MYQLGILELGEILPDISHGEIIEATIDYAKLAEENGYKRFWIGEHHEQGVAWRGPEILLAIIAGYTNTIKVGSGGILLPLNSPLRVAQNFKMLSTLFPNRIDLGICKGVSKPHINELLLNGDIITSTYSNHEERISSTIDFLRNFSEDLGKQAIETSPVSNDFPEVWVLGSSGSSIEIITKKKIGFSYSLIHTTNKTLEEQLNTFKELNKKYEDIHFEKMKKNIAITVISGEKQSDIERLKRGHNPLFKINVCGNPTECCEQIKELSEKFDTDEIMIYFSDDNINNKKYCITRLSEELNVKKEILI